MATVNVTLGLGSSDITGTGTGVNTAPAHLRDQWNAGTIAGASAGDDIVVWCHPKWWNGAGTTLSFTGTTYNSLTIKQKIDRYTYNKTSFWNMRRLTQWYNYIINWNCDEPLTIDGISLDISPLTCNWSSTGSAVILRNVMFQTFTDGSRTVILSLGADLASGTITVNDSLFLSNATVGTVLGLSSAVSKLTLNQCTLLCNTGITFQNVVRYATCNNTISAANATAGDSFHDCVLTHCLASATAIGHGNTGNWKTGLTYLSELNAAWPDPTPKAASQMASGSISAGGSGSPTSWTTSVVNSLTTDIAGTAYGSQPAVGCTSATVATEVTMTQLIAAMSVGENIPVQLDLQEAAWVPDATFVGFPSSTPKAQGTAQFDFSGGLAIGWDTGDSFYSMTISGGHVSFSGSNRYGIGENRHWTCLNTGVAQPTWSGVTPTYDAATPYPLHGYRDFCTPKWTVSGVPRDVFIYYGYAPFPGAGSTVNGGYTTNGQMPVWSPNGNTWFSNASGQEGHEAIPNAVGGPTWQTVGPGGMCVDPTNRAIAYRLDILGGTSQLIKITGTNAVDSRYAKIGSTITNPSFFGTITDGPLTCVIKSWAGDGLDYVFMVSKASGHELGLIKATTATTEDLITGARPLVASAAKTALIAALDAMPGISACLYTDLDGTTITIGVGEENSGTSLGLWEIDCNTKVVTNVTPDLSYAGGKTYPPHSASTSDYLHRERRLFPNGEEAIFTFSNGIGADSGGTNITGCLWMEKIADAPSAGSGGSIMLSGSLTNSNLIGGRLAL